MSETYDYGDQQEQSTASLLSSFGMASLIVVLGVSATWFVIKRDAVLQSTEFAHVLIPPAILQASNDENLTLLEQADFAFAAGRIIEPDYDNSLSYYTSLLEKEPDHIEAKLGIERVKSYLLTQADSAMYQNDWDAARAYARVIQGIDPSNASALQIQARSNQLESIRQLRDQAVQQLAQGNLVSPNGANAVDSYRRILTMEPDNVVAREGLRSISQRLIASAQTAIFAGEIEEAKELINQTQSIDPVAPGLAATKKSAANWEQADRDRDVQINLANAAQALRENRLMPPDDDNAFTLFQRVLKTSPNSEPAKRGIELVQTLLLDQALSRVNVEDLSGGAQVIELAAQAGADEAKLKTVTKELKYRKRLLDARAGRFEQHHALSELVNLYRKDPEYPRTAELREKKGWVHIEFVVTEKGDVRSARVVESSSKLFERNALAAVSKWRFEPVMEDGQPVPVISGVKFSFQ